MWNKSQFGGTHQSAFYLTVVLDAPRLLLAHFADSELLNLLNNSAGK